MTSDATKTRGPCPHCGLEIILTGDGRHPCAYCGGSLPANGKTYRYVSEQGGERHVSSALLTASEAADILRADAMLHEVSGWRVSVSGEGLAARIVAERDGTRRVVTIEEV